MAGKKQLPPVEHSGETVVDALASGSRLRLTRAMQNILATHLDNEGTLARDVAVLTKRMSEVTDEAEALAAVEGQSGVSAGNDDDNVIRDAPFNATAV